MTHLVAVVMLLACAARVDAQIIESLTPQQIDEAIKLGANEKMAQRFLRKYQLQKSGGWGTGPLVGIFSTPYSRVVQASLDAHRKYEKLDQDDVEPLIVSEIHVVTPSQSFTDYNKRPQVASLTAVVVMPAKSKERARAIQAIRSEDNIDRYQNLFGATFDGRGLFSVFPLSAFRETNELHVVFDRRVAGVSGMTACDDCTVPIELKGIK